MLRIAILAVGLALGYSVGYRDAQRHDRSVGARLLDTFVSSVRAFTDSEAAGAGRVTRH